MATLGYVRPEKRTVVLQVRPPLWPELGPKVRLRRATWALSTPRHEAAEYRQAQFRGPGPLIADDYTVEEQFAPQKPHGSPRSRASARQAARAGQSRHSAFARITSPGNSAKNKSGLALHASAVGIPARSQEHRPGRIDQPDESGGSHPSSGRSAPRPGRITQVNDSREPPDTSG